MAQLNDLVVTGKSRFLNDINANVTGTASNVTGTVAIGNGGTGATTRLGAAQNLTNEAVTSPGYVVGLTQNWGKFGYTTIDQLKTTIGSASAASGGTAITMVTTGEKYTWNNKSNLTIGTTSTTAMAGNTNVNNVTQTASLTANTEYGLLLTNSALDSSNHTEGARKSLYLKYSEAPGKDNSTYGTLKVLSGETSERYGVKISQCDIELITEGYTYEWTWGGISSSLDTSIRTAKTTVKQIPSTTNANYEILFSNTANNNELTEVTKKSSTLLFNPAQKALTGGTRKANTTVGEYSFSVGISNTASGYCCQAFGNEVSATNNNTFAHGYQTVASHYCAHAEGWQTTASGQSSHAEGEGTIANHRNQHVFGKFNIEDPSPMVADTEGYFIEIVGNGSGSATSSRANARTLDWDGNEWLAGNLTITGADGLNLSPSSTSSNDSADIIFRYGNGNEKARIWIDESPTAADTALNYRWCNTSGTTQRSTHLATRRDIAVFSGTKTITTSTSFVYSTVSFTVPAYSTIVVTVQGLWVNSWCKVIAVSTSSTSTSGSSFISNNAQSTGITHLSTTATYYNNSSSAITLYVWSQWNAANSNSIRYWGYTQKYDPA